MVKNILFDLDDTLLDFQQSERNALTKTLIHLEIEPNDEILSRYSEINLSQWKLLEKGILSRDEVKIRRYQLLFEDLGIIRSPKEATEYYESKLSLEHSLVDGAVDLLEKLCGKYRLFIVSNGNTVMQKMRMNHAGITRYFDDLFISQEIGIGKPAPEFFEFCFSQIPDFTHDETVIIGDSISADITGGNNAGIRTIWFNRHRRKLDVSADYEIHSLSEAEKLIKKL